MLKSEWHRIWIKQRFLLLLPLFLVLQLVVLVSEKPCIDSSVEQNRDAYLAYISPISGKLTNQTAQKLENDHKQLLQDSEEYTEMRDAYINDTITTEEYQAAVAAMEPQLQRKPVLELAHWYYEFIKEYPDDRYFMYTNGWEAFLAQDRVDIFLLLFVMLMAASLFGLDYETNAFQMIQTTEGGRRKLFLVRELTALCSIAVSCVLFFVMEYAYFSLRYGLPLPTAPLQSLPSFRNSPCTLQIWELTAGIWLSKMSGLFLVLQVMTACMMWTRNAWVSLGIGGTLIGAPFAIFNQTAIIYYFQPLGLLLGCGYFKGKADYVMTDNMVLLTTGSAGIPRSDLFLILCITITAGVLLFCLSYRIYSKQITLRAVCLAAAMALLLNGTAITAAAALSERQHERFTNTYSSGQGYSDGEFCYVLHEGLLAENAAESFSILRDVTSKQNDLTDMYKDEQYVYYVEQDADSGEYTYHRISLSDYHDECFYRELRGYRNQQKKTKYLGLIGQINIENVDDDTYTKEVLSDFWVDNGWIYTADDYGIRRVDPKSGKKEQLTDTSISGGCIAYDKGKLWYADLQNRVYSVEIESGKTEELPISKCSRLYVCGGVLYFQTYQSEVGYYDGTVHMIPGCKISGTSQVTWDGENVLFCNARNQVCAYDPAKDALRVIDSIDGALNVTAYTDLPFLLVYKETADGFAWEIVEERG